MICFVKLNMEILQYTYYIQTPRSRGLFMPTCTQHPAMSKIIKFCLWRSIKKCICSFSKMLCLVICLLAMLSYTVFISKKKKPHSSDISTKPGPQIISVWIPSARDFSFLYCTFIWVFMLFKRQTLSRGKRRDNTGQRSKLCHKTRVTINQSLLTSHHSLLPVGLNCSFGTITGSSSAQHPTPPVEESCWLQLTSDACTSRKLRFHILGRISGRMSVCLFLSQRKFYSFRYFSCGRKYVAINNSAAVVFNPGDRTPWGSPEVLINWQKCYFT